MSKRMIIGFVRLALDNQGRWRARYSFEGADIRRILPASDEVEARALAVEINKGILGGREMLPSLRPKPTTHPGGMSVNDALTIAIRNSGGGIMHKARQTRGANGFIGWLAVNHPGLVAWAELRPHMISSWARELQAAGFAFDTVRLCLFPIRQASLYWSVEEPDTHRDIARQARIRLERPPAKPIPALDATTFRRMLAWLETHSPSLHAMGLLMGGAGLRELEAGHLRECDLNLQAGTVTITDTGTHKPKNRSSYRVLPVSRMVVDGLRAYIAGQAVRNIDAGNPLFVNNAGNPWLVGALSTAWRAALDAAGRLGGIQFPDRFTPHHLRATFASLCRRAGCDVRYLQAYLGHSRNDILGGHYESISTDDLRGVVAAFEQGFSQEKPLFAGSKLAL
ncbi:MAG: tyrosine-type recombinase/integrase [bacterium]